MKRLFALAIFLLFASAQANAAMFTMEFESLDTAGGANASADGTIYTEDGMTMTHIYGHFDRYLFNANLSPDPTNYNPVIHEGNGGAGVSFSLGGSAFDLLSVDVLGWLFNGPTNPETTTVTFASSSGGIHQISATEFAANFTGTIDFSVLAGFANITGFSITLPNPNTNCATGDCPNFGFDNVTFRAPPNIIPLPAAGWLFLAGIGMMAAFRRFS